MVLAFIPMLLLVNSTPDRIPADVTAEEQDQADNKVIRAEEVETKA